MRTTGSFLARLRPLFDRRRGMWLWPLILAALLVVGVLVLGDQAPMAAILAVLL